MLKFSKKVLSLVLVLSLLVSVFAMNASALADGKSFGVVLTPDKDVTKLTTGDVVTITASCEVADFDTLFGAAKLLLVYDKNIYTPVSGSMELLGDFALFYKDVTPSSLASTSTSNWAKLVDSRMSSDEWAKYNTACVLNFAADTSKDWNEDGVNNTAATGYQMSLNEDIDGNTTRSVDQFTIQFKVTGSGAALDGARDIFISDAFGTKVSVQYFKTTTGSKATNMDTSVIDHSGTSVAANAPATPELVLAGLKQQIRFPAGTDTFDYRVFAEITNLEEIFGDVDGVNDDSDNTYATEAGFLYNIGAAIDQSIALDQINGGNATYVQRDDAYISTSTGLSDYVMACVIYDIPDPDAVDETVSVLAYVKYVQDGEEKVALVDAYTGTFRALYDRNKATLDK